MEGKSNNRWICIDVGACNSVAAIQIDGKPHVIKNGDTYVFPTIACVLPNRDIKVCQEAEAFRRVMPESFKQEFKLNIAEQIDLYGVQYVDIIREMLKYVKAHTEDINNHQIYDSVILTIPAQYTENDPRIDVMRKAAFDAGFLNIEFMPEPQAAAQLYAHIMGVKNIGLTLIYDMGGVSFNPVLIDMSDAKEPKIIGYEGRVKCGGQFFDAAIYKHIYKDCANRGIPLSEKDKLNDYSVCKKLKEALSNSDEASYSFSNGMTVSLNREELNNLIREKIASSIKTCDSMVHTAGKKWADIRQILFVGGPTVIPLIREMLENHLISQNAQNVKIIGNLKASNGTYDPIFATCLGGISSKILPPPPPPEPLAKLISAGTEIQLKEGTNTFGRGYKMDYRFDDPSMSRKHFSITVTKDAYGKWSYNLTTCSESKATIVNNFALDLHSEGITWKSILLQDGWTIRAGKTIFYFKK